MNITEKYTTIGDIERAEKIQNYLYSIFNSVKVDIDENENVLFTCDDKKFINSGLTNDDILEYISLI